MNDPPVSSIESATDKAVVASGKFRIMVVDDEPSVRQAIAQYLSGEGFEVLEAANAFDALTLIHGLENIDGVIVDINMPGMDGLEFIRRVKQRDRTIVAVVITGLPSMSVIIEAMKAGASDFLAKPFKLSNLQVAIERLTRERRILLQNLLLTEEVKAKKTIEEINARLERKIKEQVILFKISDTLGKVKSMRELYQKVVSLACSLTETPQACFWVVNRELNKLLLMGAIGEYPRAWDEIDIDGSDLPCARVIKEGLPIVLIGDALKQPAAPNQSESGIPARDQIFVPFTMRDEVFGVLSVSRPKIQKPLGEEALFLLHLLAERTSLTVENLLLYESVALNLHSTLKALVRSLEAKDPYTKEHSRRVTDLSLRLAAHLGCTSIERDSLMFAGPLHDIGKIGVRDQILLKKGRLTREEYEIIKTHPVIGEEIVGNLGIVPMEKSIIRHHHERWDGHGYPDGLKGDDIPYLARIMSVADVFDAITTDRPYRKAASWHEALAEIKNNRGSQFDPKLVDAFEDLFMEKGLGLGIGSGPNLA